MRLIENEFSRLVAATLVLAFVLALGSHVAYCAPKPGDMITYESAN